MYIKFKEATAQHMELFWHCTHADVEQRCKIGSIKDEIPLSLNSARFKIKFQKTDDTTHRNSFGTLKAMILNDDTNSEVMRMKAQR